jgi:hypothetical protein
VKTSQHRFPAALTWAVAACVCTLPVKPADAATITIDATAPAPSAKPLPFPIGDRSPDGHEISANSQFLTFDGSPWYPTAGEFHYARYPASEWEREILKMKAGGIDMVATYVFWIHHEETEGKFDWSDRRDLKRFIELCRRHGMKVWLRVGPWAHGEARNGGFPDWLVQSGARLRSNDPKYLEHVSRLFTEIAHQVHGQFWHDGGPIAAVQLENEYHPAVGGIEHMRELRKRALEAGLTPAFFSATGWDQATVPPTGFLPVFGGYTEQFWSGSLRELPPNQNFFFTPIRAEDNVMGDLTPKIAGYNSQYDGFPFLTVEMGAGMAIAYHRRPIMYADDSTAAALVKIGAGANCLGYYMYHGGTNPDALTSLQETQSVWNGYNDMEAKSYDFQAPLGEFGQINPTYRTLRTLHLFLHDFGSDVASMTPRFPNEKPHNSDDTTTPRVVARMSGERGFVFVNNYQRNYPLGDKRDFQVRLRTAGQTVTLPREPITIPDGAYPIFPVNMDLGGATLRYATAQPLCRLADPATLVFFAWPGLKAEFAFQLPAGASVAAAHGKVTRDGELTCVSDVTPSTEVALTVSLPGGAAPLRVLVLSRTDALNLSKTTLAGRERLVVSPAGVTFSGNRVVLTSRDASELHVGTYPGLSALQPLVRAGTNGVFTEFRSDFKPAALPVVTVEPVKAAGEPPAIRLSEAPRSVAMEPEDADFARAAIWKLKVASPEQAAKRRLFLQVRYVGDVARIYTGQRFDNDNFYKGTPWELGLWRYRPADLESGLDLKILALRRDAPIFLEKAARPSFGKEPWLVRLDQVKLVEEYEVTADARE